MSRSSSRSRTTLSFLSPRRTRELAVANERLQQENAARTAQLQEIQRAQNQRVQSEKLASLAQLTAGMAHELRNPLNIITNLAESSIELAQELERTCQAPPETLLTEVQELILALKRNAAVVHQHGLRAEHIIRSMMEHAQARSGRWEPTELAPIVERYLRPQPTVTVQREFDPAVGKVWAAPQDLGRLVQNLLHNALYAVGEKRRMATTAYVPTLTLRLRREEAQVLLQVEDNGTGIPKDLQGRIFEPFFTTKPPGSGSTGLGLSLSHDIVKSHGGALTMESEPGHSTCFSVRLPVHEPS